MPTARPNLTIDVNSEPVIPTVVAGGAATSGDGEVASSAPPTPSQQEQLEAARHAEEDQRAADRRYAERGGAWLVCVCALPFF